MGVSGARRAVARSPARKAGPAAAITSSPCAHTILTLDGVYQAPDGPAEDEEGGFRHGGLSLPYADQDFGSAMGNVSPRPAHSCWAARHLRRQWPKVTDQAEPIAPDQRAAKYVVSRSQRPLGWHNSHLVAGDVPG